MKKRVPIVPFSGETDRKHDIADSAVFSESGGSAVLHQNFSQEPQKVAPVSEIAFPAVSREKKKEESSSYAP